MSEGVLAICAREDDPLRLIIPGSETRPCAGGCGHPVAVSPAMLRRGDVRHPNTRFVCLECASQQNLLDGITVHPPTGAQVAEREQAGHGTKWPLEEHWGKQVVKRR